MYRLKDLFKVLQEKDDLFFVTEHEEYGHSMVYLGTYQQCLDYLKSINEEFDEKQGKTKTVQGYRVQFYTISPFIDFELDEKVKDIEYELNEAKKEKAKIRHETSVEIGYRVRKSMERRLKQITIDAIMERVTEEISKEFNPLIEEYCESVQESIEYAYRIKE